MTDGQEPYAPPPPGGPQNPTYNPYAPPKAQLGGGGGSVENAESIRRDHLNHEASLRSVGCLYYWTGIIAFVATVGGTVFGIFQLFTGDGSTFDIGTLFGFLLVYFLLGLLYFWIGKGLRDLQEKVRTAVSILSAIGLLAFPVGSLISAYILYLLHSAKGKRILTEQYRQVVAQTPYIKYRTPLWAWLVLIGLVVLLVVFVVIASKS